MLRPLAQRCDMRTMFPVAHPDKVFLKHVVVSFLALSV